MSIKIAPDRACGICGMPPYVTLHDDGSVRSVMPACAHPRLGPVRPPRMYDRGRFTPTVGDDRIMEPDALRGMRWTDAEHPSCGVMKILQPPPTPARSEAAGGEVGFDGATWEAYAGSLALIADHLESLGYVGEPRRIRAVVRALPSLLAAQREIASLRQQLAAAREDGERLDWMESKRRVRVGFVSARSKLVWHDSGGALREAIDRARTEPAREGEGGNG